MIKTVQSEVTHSSEYLFIYFLLIFYFILLVKFFKLNLFVPRIGREPKRNCPGTHPCRNPNVLNSQITKRKEMDK
jgi:hypothetical protein